MPELEAARRYDRRGPCDPFERAIASSGGTAPATATDVKHNQDCLWIRGLLLLDGRHLFLPQCLILLAALAVILPASAVSQTCLPNGDVNQDGIVTTADALLALNHALGITGAALSDCQSTSADVYPVPTASDGQITALDALCIFQRALGLMSCLDLAAGTPVAESISFQADPALPYVEKQLAGTDPDGDALTFELLEAPTGTGYTDAAVEPQSGVLYVTLAPGFTGEILLYYRVTDGRFFSAPATIRITVEASTEEPGLGYVPVEPQVYAGFESDFDRSPVTPASVDLRPNFPLPGDQGHQRVGCGKGRKTTLSARGHLPTPS